MIWGMVLIVAASGVDAARNHGNQKRTFLAERTAGKGFFEVLLKNLEEKPADKDGFIGKCSAIITKLLPDLEQEYTDIQVPHVLYQACEEFPTKEDFRRDDRPDHSQRNLVRARTHCRYFSKNLADLYKKGDTDYAPWCASVFDHLTEDTLAPGEVARRIGERDAVQEQIDALRRKLEKEQNAKLEAEQGSKRVSGSLDDEKNESESGPDGGDKSGPDGGDKDGGDKKNGGSPKSDTSDVNGTDPTGLLPWGKGWLKCCPAGCKICPGFKISKGVVRAAISVSTKAEIKTVNVTGPASHFLHHETKDADDEEDEDDDSDDEDDADEDGDDEVAFPRQKKAAKKVVVKEAAKMSATKKAHANKAPAKKAPAKQESKDEEDDTDSDDDDDEEDDIDDDDEDGEDASLLQSAKATTDGFYYKLTDGFQEELPKTKPFLKHCTAMIGRLMPILQSEYTWLQVPNIIMHDCDVHSTHEDFKADGATKIFSRVQKQHAKESCKFFAARLGDTFQKDKDYLGWCEDVYAQLLRSLDTDKELTDIQKKLVKDRPDLSQDIHNQEKGCCPANCRQC